MTLNPCAEDGFAGRFVTYSSASIPFGVFDLDDRRYGSSAFNSCSLRDGELSIFVWGGDRRHDQGIDLALSIAVPEPGTALLLSIGFVGVAGAGRTDRRRRAG